MLLLHISSFTPRSRAGVSCSSSRLETWGTMSGACSRQGCRPTADMRLLLLRFIDVASLRDDAMLKLCKRPSPVDPTEVVASLQSDGNDRP